MQGRGSFTTLKIVKSKSRKDKKVLCYVTCQENTVFATGYRGFEVHLLVKSFNIKRLSIMKYLAWIVEFMCVEQYMESDWRGK